MFFGISFQKISESEDNEKLYSRPLLSSAKPEDETIIMQIIRSNDFSYILKLNDKFTIELVLYKTKNEYLDINESKIKKPMKILGIYELDLINNLDGNNSFFHIHKVLDDSHKLSIEFSCHYRQEYHDFIIATPLITFNKSYVNKI